MRSLTQQGACLAYFLFSVIIVQSVFWVDTANFTPQIIFEIVILQNAERFSTSTVKYMCNFRNEESTTSIYTVKVCGETTGIAALPYVPVKYLAYDKQSV